MQKNIKIWVIVGVIALALIAVGVVSWETTHGNRQLFDTSFRFNYAIIRLPNGETVEGKVTSWLDFDDSDAVQVTMNGKTYLTHYTNVCLISE